MQSAELKSDGIGDGKWYGRSADLGRDSEKIR